MVALFLSSMKITDINGCSIEVIDLDEALQISKQYQEYHHEDKIFSEFDKRQKAYWMNMHEKLTAIKEQVTTH